MWLGVMSYLLFSVMVVSVSGILAKPLLNANSVILITIYNQITRFALASLSLFALSAFLGAYVILDMQLSQLHPYNDNTVDISYLFRVNYSQSLLLELAYSTTPRFFFPFFFIFMFITMFSIYFCLAYSAHEAVAFVGYCVIILSAGFILLFTDSFIIFFLAYEGLLVPSFFILYKFAKTRRCIEAAYLMFF